MNRLFTILVSASIAALVLAIGCGSWLFLQSWEEGKQLERQNRELKASLEASRIRLENFCEYPAEALCNIDEPQGSVSSAMSGLSTPAPNLPEPAHSASSFGSTLQTKPSQAEAILKEPPVPEEKTVPAQTQFSSAPKAAPQANAGQAPSAETAAHEILTPGGPGADSENTAAPTGKVKKTWSSLDIRQNALMLHIAGEGKILTAEGRLLPDPLRYEVTLHGLWNVSNRHPQTALVRDMQTSFRQSDTVLTFPLASQPGECSVRQDDNRTVTIIIQ